MRRGLLLPALVIALPALGDELLTVERAVEMALTQSPALEALQHQLDEDRTLIDVANPIPNPQLRISTSSHELILPTIEGRAYSSDPLTNSSVGVRWEPPNPGAWAADRAHAERHVDQSQAELEQARRDLAAQVRLLHATLLNLDEQQRHATTAVELHDKLRTLISRRLEHQAATVLDRNLAELDYSEAIAEREEIESRRSAVYREWLTALGATPGARFQPVASARSGCQMPAADLATLVQRAGDQAPELGALQAEIAEVDADIFGAHLELIPWFDFVQVGYELGEGDTRFALGVNDRDYAAVQFRMSINFPLFDWKQAEVAGLRARRERLEAEQRAAQYNIEGGVRHALEELRGRVALVDRHRTVDTTVVDDSWQQINRALEAGEADLVQMTMLQRRTLAAQRARLRAALRCQESAIELSRLTGDAVLTDAGGASPQ